MSITYRRGKALEDYVAKRLGGVRVGLTGKATSDVVAGQVSVECKERKELPGWLVDAVAQAEHNAGAGMIPVVVLHRLGDRHDRDLVVLRLGDFGSLGDGNDWHCIG